MKGAQMLSNHQIEYALSNFKHVDRIPDYASGRLTLAHHTMRGVYLLVYDSRDVLFKDECSYIPYTVLAMLNARRWPVSFVGGQRVTVLDEGSYYIVHQVGTRRGRMEIDKTNGKEYYTGLGSVDHQSGHHEFPVLGTKMRQDGFPIPGSEWLHESRIYKVLGHERFRSRKVVKLIDNLTLRKKTISLANFNEDYVPAGV